MTDTFTNMDSALPSMAFKVLSEGSEVGSRLGERTRELLHQQIIIDQPWQREVLVPHRNVNIAAQIAETMWVLAGRDDMDFLTNYLPRAVDFSDDGKVWRGGYGPRLRRWSFGSQAHGTAAENYSVDQVKHVVDLLSADRSSRRAVISIYDPAVDAQPGKDIPCNDFLSFISRDGFLDLSVFVRSNDVIWGWSGINAFEWSALQEIVAHLLGLNVGRLVFNTTSLHIYDRHWGKANRLYTSAKYAPLGYLDSPAFSAPAVIYATPRHPIANLDTLVDEWFLLEKKIREGHVPTGTDYLVEKFPEPMMKSWLRVLQWYWSGQERYLEPLKGTRLWAATQELPDSIQRQVDERAKPPVTVEITVEADLSGFTKAMDALGEPNASLTVGKPSGPNGEYQVGDPITVYPVHATPVPADTTGVIRPLAHKMSFLTFVYELHREKSAAYGDSWKKRGELFSIIPNIARKIDRLEGGKSTGDEIIADTAIDLLVYLIKYRLWLGEQHQEFAVAWASAFLTENDRVNQALEHLHAKRALEINPTLLDSYTKSLVKYFEHLQETVGNDPHRENVRERVQYVDQMLSWSFLLARHLWEREYRQNLDIIAEREAGATSGYVNQDG